MARVGRWLADPERRFLTALVAGMAVVEVAIAVLVGVVQQQRLTDVVIRAAGDNAASLVAALAPGSSTGEPVYPSPRDSAWWGGAGGGQRRLKSAGGFLDFHVLDARGRVVIADTPSELGSRPLSAAQWARVQAGQRVDFIGSAPEMVGRAFVSFVPVRFAGASGTARGAIEVVVPAHDVLAELAAIRLVIFVGGALALAFFAALFYLTSRRLARSAYRDALTDLPNRRYFEEAGARALAQQRRHRRPAALLMLDVNTFKQINDAYGHRAGDAALVAVAASARTNVRTEDTLARVGGDEFAVLLPEASAEQAQAVANRLTGALAQPRVIAGKRLRLTLSIGIALYPHHGGRLVELMRAADSAMYESKRHRLPYCVYRSDHTSNAASELELESDLRQALERQQLEMALQPIIDTRNGTVAFEALARWQHPDRGPVSPADFILAAERSGLIRDLDQAIFRLAAQAQPGLTQTHPGVRLHVNLSAVTLSDPKLPERLTASLEKLNLPASAFVLEVTETAAINDLAETNSVLRELQRRGFATALDDFGTGYSSLAYLERLAAQTIKLDQRFIAGIGKHQRDERLIEAISTYAHAIGLSVIAEGVETPDQAAWLTERGITLQQGYHHGKPQPHSPAQH